VTENIGMHRKERSRQKTQNVKRTFIINKLSLKPSWRPFYENYSNISLKAKTRVRIPLGPPGKSRVYSDTALSLISECSKFVADLFSLLIASLRYSDDK